MNSNLYCDNAEARQARVVGTVILQTVIQTNGTADILKIVKPLPFGLTESALEALQQWRFMPAVRNGKEIPVATNIEVAFNCPMRRSLQSCSNSASGWLVGSKEALMRLNEWQGDGLVTRGLRRQADARRSESLPAHLSQKV